MTDQLLREGIDAFMVPMNKLLTGIEVKREQIVTHRPASLEADLPDEQEQPVAERVKLAREQDVVRRLWRKDGTLWAPPGTAELEDRLGWLTIFEKVLEALPDIKAFAAELREEGFTDVVLLGMGGSSLAPEVFRRSTPPSEGALRLHVLDSTEPLEVEKVAGAVDMAKTLFIVSSKSGGTIEPNALLAHFRGRQPDPRHFVAITDPGTSMAKLAESEGFRRTFLSDPEIGGRYSALSPFGIVPAALAGVDVQAVLEGAEVAAENCELPEGNSGLWLGAALGELARRGRDKLTFVVDAPLSSFGLWAEQLVAESTGKQKRGILPIADEPLADPSHYGPDRVFVHLRDADAPDPRHEEAMRALAKAGQADDRAHRERRQRPGEDLLPVRVRHRGGGLGPGDQPVRPAQRPGGQGQHHARPAGGRAGRPPGGRARGHPQRPGAARTTWPSWATCPTRTRSTRR